jgi:Peptide N-acetyl-beta-D-glucosaminyl asparaginase amidase A
MLTATRSLGLLSLLVSATFGLPTSLQAQALTVGSKNVATADPLVPRPPSAPCTVTLLDAQPFADFSSKPITFTPPASCPGPWQKVVFAGDLSMTGTRQYDRTAQLWLGGALIYFGTTQEPSIAPPASTTWHVERDLTDYSALFGSASTGHADIGNFVGTSAGVTYDGVITGTFTISFYPVVTGVRQAALQPRPDVLLPVSASADGGTANLGQTSDQLVANFATLPPNIERAYLDVYAQSQSNDEFWYFDLPNDIAALFQDNGNTAFKETQVSIDGQPAGIAPIYPWIYTGGADPILWRPTPGVQALSFEPYRVDLTPFVSVLSDGKAHSIALAVYNSAGYFAVAGNLMLYLDPGVAQMTGSVTNNTLSLSPTVNVVENIVGTDASNSSGTVLVTSDRQYSITGTARTSHGVVTTQIDTAIAFSSNQKLATSDNQYVQDTVQTTQTDVVTTRTSGTSVAVVHEQRSYPLTFDYEINVADDGSQTQYTNVDQEFLQQVDVSADGAAPSTATRNNIVLSTVTRNYDTTGALASSPATSVQLYTYDDPFGACYSREIVSQNRVLAGVANGSGCRGGINILSWRDRYSQAESTFNGATIQLLP